MEDPINFIENVNYSSSLFNHPIEIHSTKTSTTGRNQQRSTIFTLVIWNIITILTKETGYSSGYEWTEIKFTQFNVHGRRWGGVERASINGWCPILLDHSSNYYTIKKSQWMRLFITISSIFSSFFHIIRVCECVCVDLVGCWQNVPIWQCVISHHHKFRLEILIPNKCAGHQFAFFILSFLLQSFFYSLSLFLSVTFFRATLFCLFQHEWYS